MFHFLPFLLRLEMWLSWMGNIQKFVWKSTEKGRESILSCISSSPHISSGEAGDAATIVFPLSFSVSWPKPSFSQAATLVWDVCCFWLRLQFFFKVYFSCMLTSHLQNISRLLCGESRIPVFMVYQLYKNWALQISIRHEPDYKNPRGGLLI